MENTSINWTAMSDKAIIEAIGEYLRHERLSQNKTQSQIAHHAGLNRWTVSQIENGEPISMTSLIQILRALDQLNLLNTFNIKSEISPIELAKLERQKRQRARNNETDKPSNSNW